MGIFRQCCIYIGNFVKEQDDYENDIRKHACPVREFYPGKNRPEARQQRQRGVQAALRPLRVNEIRLVELKSTIDENKLKEKFHSSEELMERYVRPADSLARAAMDAKAMAWFYGEILRDRRKELKMSQAALVEKAGAKQSYIARIEKGEVDMQLSSLIRIAGALRLNLQLQ